MRKGNTIEIRAYTKNNVTDYLIADCDEGVCEILCHCSQEEHAERIQQALKAANE